MSRKVIACHIYHDNLYVLLNDGTMWRGEDVYGNGTEFRWMQVAGPPDIKESTTPSVET